MKTNLALSLHNFYQSIKNENKEGFIQYRFITPNKEYLFYNKEEIRRLANTIAKSLLKKYE